MKYYTVPQVDNRSDPRWVASVLYSLYYDNEETPLTCDPHPWDFRAASSINASANVLVLRWSDHEIINSRRQKWALLVGLVMAAIQSKTKQSIVPILA